jgi:hypothetical protein
MLESCCMEMALPEAVNGPMVAGVDGSVSSTGPVTGLGRVTLKSMVPVDMVAGVAPVASIFVDALPVSVGETASAAEASACGRDTVTWYPVTLNVCPDVGLEGDSVAAVAASLRAMLPTGVPGQ